MRKALFIVSFIFLKILVHQAPAQKPNRDSLNGPGNYLRDTTEANRLNALSRAYIYDSAATTSSQTNAYNYAKKALELSLQYKYLKGEGDALFNMGIAIYYTPNESNNKAIGFYLRGLPLKKQYAGKKELSECYAHIGDCLHMLGDFIQAIKYFDSARIMLLQLKDSAGAVFPLVMEGHCYYDMGNYRQAYQVGAEAVKEAQNSRDSIAQITALIHLANLFLGAGLPETSIDYVHRATELYRPAGNPDTPHIVEWGLMREGMAWLKLGQPDSADRVARLIRPDTADGDNQLFFGNLYFAHKDYQNAFKAFKKGLEIEKAQSHEIGISKHADQLGQTYLSLKQYKAAIQYATIALDAAAKIHALLEMRNAVGTLRDIYIHTKNYGEAFHYDQWYQSLNDSVAPDEYRQKLSLIHVQNELQNQKQQALYLARENDIKGQLLGKSTLVRKLLIAGIFSLLLLVIFIIRNNTQKRKANALLKEQKSELESTLNKLKATQRQLVQSEKMASLGELTAGIAHEIQNPLNFVNNFSEVNDDLVKELDEELGKGNVEAARQLAKDISMNEQKINHHGKRADAIVKSMLLHSQTGSSQKGLTDINALTEEYLKLSYHGLRAKDKFFNATLHADYDPGLPRISVIPQEIGRTLLNIFNNAFYAVSEKKKKLADHYQPTVWVTTFQKDRQVCISIKDNGMGIPQKIVDKIFQPFFTTKPTGQGTGLGLSLTYDIITKSHGGTLKVDTIEGEFALFTIALPIENNT